MRTPTLPLLLLLLLLGFAAAQPPRAIPVPIPRVEIAPDRVAALEAEVAALREVVEALSAENAAQLMVILQLIDAVRLAHAKADAIRSILEGVGLWPIAPPGAETGG